CDIMHVSRKVPIIPVFRQMNLAQLIAARAASPQRVGWCAIFLKAFAMVAAEMPEFRRSYMAFPWPRLFENKESIGILNVEREIDGEHVVMIVQIRHPNLYSLSELERKIQRFKTAPPYSISGYRHMRRMSWLPRWLRRHIMISGLNVFGYLRAQFFGTYGVTSISH